MIPSFEDIDNPALLKQLPKNSLLEYSNWLRNYLIESIAEYGGHFAANLGVVELTIALHYTFETPNLAFVIALVLFDMPKCGNYSKYCVRATYCVRSLLSETLWM